MIHLHISGMTVTLRRKQPHVTDHRTDGKRKRKRIGKPQKTHGRGRMEGPFSVPRSPSTVSDEETGRTAFLECCGRRFSSSAGQQSSRVRIRVRNYFDRRNLISADILTL